MAVSATSLLKLAEPLAVYSRQGEKWPDPFTDSNAATFAVQSFLFAKLVEVFQYLGQKLLDAANFWSLMFFIEAIGVGFCYFVLGWTANTISVVSVTQWNNCQLLMTLLVVYINHLSTRMLREHLAQTNALL